MAPASERLRIRRTLWVATSLCALAIAVAVAMAEPVSRHAAVDAGRIGGSPSALAKRLPDRSALDGLREDAVMGRPLAGQTLVVSLLDRYDGSGDIEDLFEAMQWFDRDWGTDNQTWPQVTTRIYARYCSHRVLQWHWLCLTAE